jgi:anaerobic magnesium-protoporphyrin IX monomethyl ester cyclase
MEVEAMKIVLIKAPYLQIFGPMRKSAPRYFPLGLGYIAAALQQAGHDVVFLDPEIQGLSHEALVQRLQSENPMLVGIGCATPNFIVAQQLAQQIKHHLDVVTVLGGIHASSVPRDILEHHPEFDVLVVGEGEETIVELAATIASRGLDPLHLCGIKGIGYRHRHEVVLTPRRALRANIDTIPFPARDLAGFDRYKSPAHLELGKRTANLISSRGCPARCTFCESWRTLGNKFRGHSPAYVLAEIEHLVEAYSIEHVVFNDDTFTWDIERTREFCELLLEKNLGVTWFAFSRVDTVTPELLALMQRAGCVALNFGVESGDAHMLQVMKKGATLDQARQALTWSRELGFKTLASFLFGLPGETLASIERTIDFAIELNPNIALFNVLVPFPGTEVYARLPRVHTTDARALAAFKTASAGGEPLFIAEGLTAKALKRALVRANRRFYLRPMYLAEQLRWMTSLEVATANLRGAVGLLRKTWQIASARRYSDYG